MHFVKKNFQIFGKNIFEVILLKIWKNTVLFCLGGMGYVGLELLWRRRSHGSMFVLGGACFLALGALRKSATSLSPLLRATAGAGIITALELAAGSVVNRQHGIWDYSQLPCNYRGQICLPFTLLWIPVAGFGMWLHNRLDRAISQSAFF